MLTRNKIKAAMRQANWKALNAEKLEYRVVVADDGETIRVQEWPGGNNGYYPGETILKIFWYWPALENTTPRSEQSAYINDSLDSDVDAAIEYCIENGIRVRGYCGMTEAEMNDALKTEMRRW